MRQFFKIVFACLFALVLFFALIFMTTTLLVAGLSAGSDAVSIEKNSVLLIDLNHLIEEQGQEDLMFNLGGDQPEQEGLNHLVRAIREAARDKNVQGVYLKMGICPNGWAQLRSLQQALLEFKKSKKFILAYGEMADQKSLYVASVADKRFLNPTGMIEFKGLSITGTFFKGTLEKLGVTTEAFHCGKYKGAYEPFKFDKFSDSNRYQLTVLLHDLYDEYLNSLAVSSGQDTATLVRLANEGLIKQPGDAVRYGIISGLCFTDSVEQLIRSKCGLANDEKIAFVYADEYVESLSESGKLKEKIAILYASGEIHDGSGQDGIYAKNMIKTIRKIIDDDQIKAVVLRVNSPGGSAMASESIYHELMRLKARKPLVVSMSNYAASGGYYIACAADSLFAEPNTITGSIGVVGVLFNVGRMMNEKLGVSFDHIKTGPYADFPNMTRPMTETERAWIQSYLDTTYHLFKTRVSQARNLSMEQVENLAQGHVYSGKEAVRIKLVDRLGSLEDAVVSARKQAGLQQYKIVEYPKPIDPFQEIMNSLEGGKPEEAILKQFLGEDFVIYQTVKKIRNQENKVQTIFPYQLDIR